MLYVLLTILSSLAISLLLKFNETRNGDRMVVAGANYIVAAALGYLFSESVASIEGGWLWYALLVGAGFVAGFLLLMRTIREIGLAVPISIARIATLGPVVLSVIVYGERPGPLEWTGVVIGLIAFITLGGAQRKSRSASNAAGITLDTAAILLICALFAVMVFNDFSIKVAQTNGVDIGTFLLFLFGASAAICWGVILGRMLRRSGNGSDATIRPYDLLVGALLGVPNYFSSHFLIHALRELPASTVFPVVSAGGVLITTLAAVTIWRERLSGLSWIGIGLAALAVALLGMG